MDDSKKRSNPACLSSTTLLLTEPVAGLSHSTGKMGFLVFATYPWSLPSAPAPGSWWRISYGYEMKETGTAVSIQGPRFSSRAESNMFRMWGADVVNMTTVPEVVLAKEAGLSFLSIALPTDYDCWKDTVLDQQSVMAVFASNISRVKTLIENVVGKIGQED